MLKLFLAKRLCSFSSGKASNNSSVGATLQARRNPHVDHKETQRTCRQKIMPSLGHFSIVRNTIMIIMIIIIIMIMIMIIVIIILLTAFSNKDSTSDCKQLRTFPLKGCLSAGPRLRYSPSMLLSSITVRFKNKAVAAGVAGVGISPSSYM